MRHTPEPSLACDFRGTPQNLIIALKNAVEASGAQACESRDVGSVDETVAWDKTASLLDQFCKALESGDVLLVPATRR